MTSATEATVSELEGLKRPLEDDEVEDEDAEEVDDKYETLSDDGTSAPEKRRSKPVYTGRGVTLNMLMNEHLIEPGELCMSIEYLVRTVLLPPANEVWGKVMFYTCLSVHRGKGGLPRGGLLNPPHANPP